MKISLVIRCYNEEKDIGRLLTGVLQQTMKDVEIIVVDSGSTDRTLEIVSEYPVKLLHIPKENFSFGRSLNLGCESATGEIIVIASAHVYPTYQDWLERLVSPFSDPQVAVAYGKQKGDETSRYSEQRLLARWFPDQSNYNQDNPFCNNANSAIRRNIWERLKYDESLTGLEDTDWAKRAIALGFKIAYVAEADVVHLHKESMARIYNRYRREAIALKHIFPAERFGLWDFVRLSVANIASDYRHARQDGVLNSQGAKIIGFRLMQFWGTYRGFGQHGPVTSQLMRTFYYPQDAGTKNVSQQEAETQRQVEYSDGSMTHPPERPN